MQEFGTMCTERDTETVKGVLPYWPRIFCKISLVSIKTLLVYFCCIFFGWSHGDSQIYNVDFLVRVIKCYVSIVLQIELLTLQKSMDIKKEVGAWYGGSCV